nr:septal ring lytic transglycosylase RlpA family protein [Desulfurispira natronophila]
MLAIVILSLLVLSACGPRDPRPYSPARGKDFGVPAPHAPGTLRPYTIDGQRYYPVESVSTGFRERGIASWYGHPFHGRKTSNGETYDMYKFTAAHKTLPMNVYVQVNNLDNGKSTIVRINDRGPFAPGRIIDLSKSAADRIDMVNSGIAQVEIIVLGYNLRQPTGRVARSQSSDFYRSREMVERGNFSLQVGAFRSHDSAQAYAEELRQQHPHVQVIPHSTPDGTMYRVRLGRFTSLETAELESQRLQRRGVENVVVAQ